MKALTFTLLLKDPVLTSRLGAGEENSSTADTHIPGSAVRGAIIAEYLKYHPGSDISQDSSHRKYFFDGEVRFLNAYPLDSKGSRSLPVPLSWKQEKELATQPDAPVYDFAVSPTLQMTSIKSPGAPFVSFGEGRLEWVSVDHAVRMHNASEDRFTKRQGLSTVYRYDALAPGQRFGAVIISEEKNLLEDIQVMLSSVTCLYLGGSRSAGYGKADVIDLALAEDWVEYQGHTITDATVLRVTFLSDAVVRDQYGQLIGSIHHLVGSKPLAVFAKGKLTGGFNRKWGLPLPQSPVIQAGSVFTFSYSETILANLFHLAEKGVGERLAEGYGRIAINWIDQDEIKPAKEQTDSTSFTQSVVKLSEESRALASQMAGRRLRNVLNRKLTKAMAEIRIAPLPKNAQLARIRQVAQLMLREQSTEALKSHLAGLKTSAKNQLSTARIGNTRLINWLDSLASSEEVWDTYLKPAADEIPSIAGVPAQITSQIRIEYLARLLDGIMRKASRSQ